MRNKKILITSTLLSILCIACIFTAFAHSGRTDSNGGHWDRSTGTYHYHSGENAGKSTSTSSDNKDRYTLGYTLGYNAGYKVGYEAGYDTGHHDGYEEGYDAQTKNLTELILFYIIVIAVIIIIVALVKFIKKRRNKRFNDNLEPVKSVNENLEEELDGTRNNHHYYQFTLFEGSDADET